MKGIFKIIFALDMLGMYIIAQKQNLKTLLHQLLNFNSPLHLANSLQGIIENTIVVIVFGLFEITLLFLLLHLIKKTPKENKVERSDIRKHFFNPTEHLYMISYIGIGILAFNISGLESIIVLLVFYFILKNTRLIYFCPILGLLKYHIYMLNDNTKEEMLILRGNKLGYTKIINLVRIDTDILMQDQLSFNEENKENLNE